ncbi:MAG: hypothetical protein JXJ17_18610 [Anaerolineae bacterium]|nr:hypothetical protein [Anaerolineae bacterium]
MKRSTISGWRWGSLMRMGLSGKAITGRSTRAARLRDEGLRLTATD